MHVPGINPAGSPLPLGPTPQAESSAGVSRGFARALEGVLGQAAEQNVRSQQAVLDLALGKTTDMHHVVLEVARADLAFRLLLEVRNRLSDAYQEVMKMQL